MTRKVLKTDEEWKQELTPEQYQVCRKKGTERPFTGKYVHCYDDGIYHCACCGAELFDSATKFDSGTGWPSFWAPLNEAHIETETDHSFFMQRTEVHCRVCGAHLGHVFDDGPAPTHQRYCINAVSLTFYKKDE